MFHINRFFKYSSTLVAIIILIITVQFPKYFDLSFPYKRSYSIPIQLLCTVTISEISH